MNFFNSIFKSLDSYFSKNENEEIAFNNVTINGLVEERDAYKKLYDEALAINEGLKLSKEESVDMRMFKSLEELKAHNDSIPSEVIKYPWRGDNKDLACHYQIRDVNIPDFLNYIETVLKYNIYDKDLEDVIFNVVQKFYRKYPNTKFYVNESNDKWETPNDGLKKFIKGLPDDCDTHGSVIYGLIYSIVATLSPKDLWRVKVAVVKVLSGELHYIVLWAKDVVNDWVVVESTWYKFSFLRTWRESLPFRLQIAYELRWAFNDRNEYRGV